MPPEKTREISISPESQDFPRTMYYNRFYVERAGPVRIFYFGLLDAEDYVRDAYACAIDEETIQRQKPDLLDYVARAADEGPKEQFPWRPKVTNVHQVQLANLIQAARSGSLAETRLFNYSIGDAIDAMRKSGSKIIAAPIALLRCEETIQRAMFLAMYGDDRITPGGKAQR